MTSQLRVATLAGDPQAEEGVAASIAGSADLELVMRCMDRVELLAVLRSGTADVVVSVGVPLWLDRQAVEEALDKDVRLIGLPSDPLEAERLRSWGVALGPPAVDPGSLAQLFSSAEAVPPPPPFPASRAPAGKLVAVWGPKGSPGRTSLSIEIASQLSRAEPETILIDGDPYGGDVLQLLGIVEELPTVVWAARAAAKEELDVLQLTLALRRAGLNGPIVLAGIPRADLAAEVSGFGWRQLLSVSRDAFRFSVCDVGFCIEPPTSMFSDGEGRNHMARAALREADVVVAVCRADDVGIKQFLWSFEQLLDIVPRDRVVVVANRVRQGTEAEVGEVIRRYADKRPAAYVPERPAEFAEAVRFGVPVGQVRGKAAEVAQALAPLVAAVGGRVQQRGLLARLGGRT